MVDWLHGSSCAAVAKLDVRETYWLYCFRELSKRLTKEHPVCLFESDLPARLIVRANPENNAVPTPRALNRFISSTDAKLREKP